MYQIIVQYGTDKPQAPKPAAFRKWAKAALKNQIESAEVSIRIVDANEMRDLNNTYRKKDKPTNVLSFPFTMPDGVELDVPILGDIAICEDVVIEEAKAQNINLESHWAHMVVHGIYHLLGYDHIQDKDAKVMEALEVETLVGLGFEDPYESGDSIKNYE
jgi:probable rRNA maturation factor